MYKFKTKQSRTPLLKLNRRLSELAVNRNETSGSVHVVMKGIISIHTNNNSKYKKNLNHFADSSSSVGTDWCPVENS